MFRRGGEVGGGITSGMRENYAIGTKPSERIKAVLDQYSSPAIDPINQLLIEGGLRGMSTAGKGGTLANLASAFEAPVGQALKARTAGKSLGTAGALKGLELGIKKDIADKALDRKLAKGYESSTIAAITKEVQNALGKDVVGEEARRVAVNIAVSA